MGSNVYLQQLTLSNVRGFRTGAEAPTLNFRRPDGSYEGWTVVAGRNGSGKSTFLRAIALALAGPTVARSLVSGFGGWINDQESEAAVHAAFSYGPYDAWGKGGQPPKRQAWAGLKWTKNSDGPEPTLEEDLPPSAPKTTPRRGPWYENPYGWFLAGYGPMRRLTGAATDAQRLMLGHKRVAALVTLFDESASLAESTWWLQEIYPRQLEGHEDARALLEDVLRLLNDGLLPDEFQIDGYDSAGLWVRRGDVRLVLEEMSDGYRVVTALVLDMVRRLYASHGYFKLVSDADGGFHCPQEGVVLIDEIDAHLHVSWQQRIGFWLRKHFPKIQFIVSTHSPFVCQAASPRGLIRLAPPSQPGHAPEFLPDAMFDLVVNGSLDRIVMSELFGMESPYSEKTLHLRQELRQLEQGIVTKALDSSEPESPDAGSTDSARLDDLRARLGVRPSDDVAAALQSIERALREGARA